MEQQAVFVEPAHPTGIGGPGVAHLKPADGALPLLHFHLPPLRLHPGNPSEIRMDSAHREGALGVAGLALGADPKDHGIFAGFGRFGHGKGQGVFPGSIFPFI